LNLSGQQPGDDQSVKFIVCAVADKTPAQMGLAASAEGHLPGKAGKPGEIFAWCVVGEDAGCGLKAAEFKGDSGRIEKGVLMATVDAD